MSSRTVGAVSLAVVIAGAMLPAGAAAAGAARHRPVTPTVQRHTELGSGSEAAAAARASTSGLLSAMAHAPTAAAAGRAWLAQQATHALSGRDAATRLPGVLDDFVRPGDSIEAAGKLTGNGRQQVLDTRLTKVKGDFTLGVTIRDGRSGRPLWTRTVAGPDQFAFPLTVGRVGTPAAPGVLVALFSTTPVSGGSQSVSVRVQAWRGVNGATLWTSAPVTGTVSIAGSIETDTGVPTFPNAVRALAGRGEDAFLPTETSTSSTDTEAASGSATAELVDGRDGALTSPYSVVTSRHGVPNLESVPDLNGDHLSDVLAVAAGHPGSVVAETGNSGHVLWTDSTAVPRDAFLFSVGRLSGGTAPDFALDGTSVRVLRGSNGTVILHRSGGKGMEPPDVQQLGPAGPHGTRAVAFVSQGDVFPGSANRFGQRFVVRAVSASNRVIWTRRLSATLAFSGHSVGGSSSEIGPVGDVQPDGTTDLMVAVFLRSGHHHKTFSGIIDGRTGRFHAVKITGNDGPAAGSLVRGRGTDIIDTTSVQHGVRLVGYDGATGRRLMSVRVPAFAGKHFATAGGFRVSGHDCSDLAVRVQAHHQIQDVVLSGNGSRLWQLRHATDQATGGKLVTFKAPKQFCAK
jgi:hypothetical protein